MTLTEIEERISELEEQLEMLESMTAEDIFMECASYEEWELEVSEVREELDELRG